MCIKGNDEPKFKLLTQSKGLIRWRIVTLRRGRAYSVWYDNAFSLKQENETNDEPLWDVDNGYHAHGLRCQAQAMLNFYDRWTSAKVDHWAIAKVRMWGTVAVHKLGVRATNMDLIGIVTKKKLRYKNVKRLK